MIIELNLILIGKRLGESCIFLIDGILALSHPKNCVLSHVDARSPSLPIQFVCLQIQWQFKLTFLSESDYSSNHDNHQDMCSRGLKLIATQTGTSIEYQHLPTMELSDQTSGTKRDTGSKQAQGFDVDKGWNQIPCHKLQSLTSFM